VLHGRTGQRRVVSDAIGQPVSISEPHPESPGDSVRLTLDANIQQRTEDVLGAVAQAFSPKDATAIVMDPRDGSVLAIANWPQENANEPGVYSAEARRDRSVNFPYEPGSTFKAIAVSGALQQGLITPESGFAVPGQIQVADRTIHDDTEHGVETLSTSQILARSSNVGAIEIGKLLGATRFNSWVHRFGFGAPTRVGLPGEEPGVTLALDHYSGSSMGNLPIGQGELVTPMQMATAYAAIADGGILRPPHIVSEIGGRDQPVPAGRRILSPTTAAEVTHMLEGVLGPEGTASEVSVPGYTLAGKTGTASKVDPETGEYSKSKYVASFIGFAPAQDPRLLTAVVVDEPQNGSIFGGTVAAPAFGQIMSFALPYLGIQPH
jgi:cell division protein FtsI (penicillin-binding protein 3)